MITYNNEMEKTDQLLLGMMYGSIQGMLEIKIKLAIIFFYISNPLNDLNSCNNCVEHLVKSRESVDQPI